MKKCLVIVLALSLGGCAVTDAYYKCRESVGPRPDETPFGRIARILQNKEQVEEDYGTAMHACMTRERAQM